MKKILIDIDKVICYSNFLREINKWLGTEYIYDDFKNNHIDDILGSEEEIKRFNEETINADLYDNPEIFPDAIKTIEKLTKIYDVYILAAGVNPLMVKASGICFANKYKFVVNYLPFIDPNKIILTGSKNIIKADIQIDDQFKHLKNDVPLKLLFTSHHNKNITNGDLATYNIIRVNSWKEIAEILL